MTGYHGHKTLIDGTHVPITEDEAEAIWKAVDEAKAKRLATMPTAEDALRSLIEAQQRLNELGWWQGGGLRVKRGDDCAVAQTGSTGIWTGHVGDEYVTFCDSVSKPREVWLKPLAALTDDERRHMEACNRREAQAFEADLKRYAALSEPPMTSDTELVERLAPSWRVDEAAGVAVSILRNYGKMGQASDLSRAIVANNDLKREAASAIEWLCAERDEARAVLNENFGRTLVQANHDLREEVERLREALRPFAEKSQAFDAAADQMGFARSDDTYRPKTHFTHGDLRRARAALDQSHSAGRAALRAEDKP